jgi:DNA replication protein DnaC
MPTRLTKHRRRTTTKKNRTTKKKTTNKKTKPATTSDTSLRKRIFQYLEILKIPLPADQFDEIITSVEKEKLSGLMLLERFLSPPARLRQERSVQRRIQTAGFPTDACFENFDWKFNERTIHRDDFEQLGTGDFVLRRENVVFVGESGLGKTHLIESIGRRCCVVGYRVKYVTSAELLEDLASAAGDKTLPGRIRYYSRFELLIIDELGFEKLELREYPEAPSLLYKVIDTRQHRSTALVTNIEFKSWTDYFRDPSLTMALLDRVVDSAIIHKFQGKSYREHRAQQQQAKRRKTKRQPRA